MAIFERQLSRNCLLLLVFFAVFLSLQNFLLLKSRRVSKRVVHQQNKINEWNRMVDSLKHMSSCNTLRGEFKRRVARYTIHVSMGDRIFWSSIQVQFSCSFCHYLSSLVVRCWVALLYIRICTKRFGKSLTDTIIFLCQNNTDSFVCVRRMNMCRARRRFECDTWWRYHTREPWGFTSRKMSLNSLWVLVCVITRG